MTAPILRLFTKPITIIKREQLTEDEWGQEVWTETAIPVFGHYQQMRTGDPDALGGTVVFENLEVFIPPHSPAGPYAAVELELHGVTERMEVVGQPAEEWNARLGVVNHLKVLVRRSAP